MVRRVYFSTRDLWRMVDKRIVRTLILLSVWLVFVSEGKFVWKLGTIKRKRSTMGFQWKCMQKWIQIIVTKLWNSSKEAVRYYVNCTIANMRNNYCRRWISISKNVSNVHVPRNALDKEKVSRSAWILFENRGRGITEGHEFYLEMRVLVSALLSTPETDTLHGEVVFCPCVRVWEWVLVQTIAEQKINGKEIRVSRWRIKNETTLFTIPFIIYGIRNIFYSNQAFCFLIVVQLFPEVL